MLALLLGFLVLIFLGFPHFLVLTSFFQVVNNSEEDNESVEVDKIGKKLCYPDTESAFDINFTKVREQHFCISSNQKHCHHNFKL